MIKFRSTVRLSLKAELGVCFVVFFSGCWRATDRTVLLLLETEIAIIKQSFLIHSFANGLQHAICLSRLEKKWKEDERIMNYRWLTFFSLRGSLPNNLDMDLWHNKCESFNHCRAFRRKVQLQSRQKEKSHSREYARRRLFPRPQEAAAAQRRRPNAFWRTAHQIKLSNDNGRPRRGSDL